MKFPLKLSCGHMAGDSCSCQHSRVYDNNSDSPIDIALRDFNGQWRQVLEGYGCQLPGGKKHGACPVCGGKDRFRFDDKNGRGTWFCSHCDPQSGGGLLLLSRFIGKTTMETAKELVGDDIKRTTAPKRVQVVDYDAIRAKNIEQAKKSAASLLSQAVTRAHPYLDNKGLHQDGLVNGSMMIGKDGERIQVGELLLVPAYKKGELVNMQKIKIDGEKRPLVGGDMQGVYHKIDGKTKMIAIAEGYATGLTVNKLTGATTYCAFNTGNLADVGKYVKEQYPDSTLVFFADNDEHGAGLKYAEEAATPIGAVIALPLEVGDWDDYRQKHGDEATKQAMRDVINKDRKHVEPPAPKPVTKSAPKIVVPTGPQYGLPAGVTLDDLDIDSPPGLAGEIVDYIKGGASRLLQGGAYSSMALQCMAMAGAGLQGMKGVKLSLITLTLGMSAAGKEHPQRVVKELLDANGKTVYGDIRSDKDVIRSAIYDNGHCFYVVDEAQKILAGGGQNKHMANVVSTLMELSTTSCYKLSQLHRDEFLSQIELGKARFEKMLTAKEEALLMCNPDLDEGKMKALDLEISNIKKRIEEHEARAITATNGVKNPSLNLLAYSTPQKLAAIVDEDSIESGFLGRALICDCGVERSESLVDLDSLDDTQGVERGINPQMEYLKAQVGLICQLADDVSNTNVEQAFSGKPFRYRPTPEALEQMKSIARHYDQYHYRNHARVGAIYARLFERVMSLSSVMALGNIKDGEAVIESEFVRYALMLTLGSIDHLTSNLRINEGATDQTMEARIEAVKESVIKRLSVAKNDDMDGWRYRSEIKNQIKRKKFYITIQNECVKEGQDAFENALATMNSQVEHSPDRKQIRLRK